MTAPDPYAKEKRIAEEIIYLLKENFNYQHERYSVLRRVKQKLQFEDIEKFLYKKGRLIE